MEPKVKKRGKLIKVNVDDNYKVFFGCVDKHNPMSLYINISSWATPVTENEEEYTKFFGKLNKEIKQKIYNYTINNNKDFIANDRTIIDLDIRESGIKFGKKSFMSCEITFFFKTMLPINQSSTINELTEITKLVINDVFNNNQNLKFTKTKK
jgi:hypothetical protein